MKNIGKKSLVTLMAVSALVPVMSAEVSASTPNAESDFEFSNGRITKYVGDSKDVVIPSSIGGVEVTSIGDRAFFNKSLTSVEIPNSVTYIGESAFSTNNLSKVDIPTSVVNIYTWAFSDNNLTSLEIPTSVKQLGVNPFRLNPNLNTIKISTDNPNYFSTKDNNAIYTKDGKKLITGTSSMKDYILDTVTEIGESAFFGTSLTTVVIPNSVTKIGSSAFNTTNLTSVEIPNSVISIGSSAFSGNNLTSVEIPNTVMSIGSSAFSENNLTSVEIPNSVTSIERNTFANNKLSTVKIPNSVMTIGDYAFLNNNLTSVEIPNLVMEIGESAFHNNNLTSVEIPNSVTKIGESAFNANNLTSVAIPNSVTKIGNWAFRINPLTHVTIPESVTSIGTNAFQPSSPLTTADVPIQGKKGSQAETYATTNGHPFNALPEPNEHSQEATLNLFGGTLSLDAPLFEPFGTVELQSDVQTVTSNFTDSFKVYDARGTGEGWRLDVTSTQMEMVEPEEGFKDGTSTHVLPVGTLALDPLESIKPYNDSNGILPTPVLVSTSIIDDGAITIAKADVGEGMGAFELTFGGGAFSATIDPSTAKIDKINYPDSDTPYEATVTWTLVSAP